MPCYEKAFALREGIFTLREGICIEGRHLHWRKAFALREGIILSDQNTSDMQQLYQTNRHWMRTCLSHINALQESLDSDWITPFCCLFARKLLMASMFCNVLLSLHHQGSIRESSQDYSRFKVLHVFNSSESNIISPKRDRTTQRPSCLFKLMKLAETVLKQCWKISKWKEDDGMYVRYVTTHSPDCAKSRSRLLALPHSATTSYKYRLLVPNVKEILHFISKSY